MKTNNQLCHEILGLCWHKAKPEFKRVNSGMIQKDCECGASSSWERIGGQGRPEPVFRFSNPDYEGNIADAWRLVEWMKKKDYVFQLQTTKGKTVKADFYKGIRTEKCKGEADTAPAAIVAAFLKAIK